MGNSSKSKDSHFVIVVDKRQASCLPDPPCPCKFIRSTSTRGAAYSNNGMDRSTPVPGPSLRPWNGATPAAAEVFAVTGPQVVMLKKIN